ncbi:MAG: acetyl-coenzyme A synthetase, partial [Thermoplasmatales archaeon]|nr:acetyl-coenzyme A synthetase [Thermoplasmatales archaeon]
MAEEDISVLLDEKRVFKPKEELVNNTNVKQWMDEHDIKDLEELYKKAENWEWFWDEVSKNLVEWYEP